MVITWKINIFISWFSFRKIQIRIKAYHLETWFVILHIVAKQKLLKNVLKVAYKTKQNPLSVLEGGHQAQFGRTTSKK